MAQHLKLYIFALACTILLTITPGPACASSPDSIVIKSVRYEKKSDGIVIEMSQKSICEAIHIDGNAILIAVKNGVFNKPGSITNKDDQVVADVSADTLPGNILGLLIKTDKNISGIDSNWLSDGKSLLITMK